jgi:AraC family transcriptional regulator, regulatory protein of adaptative response / methylated-DNA-[protein]-cysteine methyltransferase
MHKILISTEIDTPLGPMLAFADEEALYLLEFTERRNLKPEIERLKKNLKATVVPGETEPLRSIRKELHEYFQGNLNFFKTPACWVGSPFQKLIWQELQKIPYGTTRSYLDIANAIGRPTACRAVARANSTNQLAILIPCHRVINANGCLGGYAGGLERKTWLLQHEKVKR